MKMTFRRRCSAPMPLSAGTRIGAMKSSAPSARAAWARCIARPDIRLKRQVALKLLPASMAGDEDRLARFQREAEVLAFLNHRTSRRSTGSKDTGVRDA